MYMVTPVEITTTNAVTNLVNDYADWAAGTHTFGDRRVVADSVYEVVVTSTTDDPTTGAAKDPPSWIRLGFSNEWRMFTLAGDSRSVSGSVLTCVLDLGIGIDTVALLGVVGTSIYLKIETTADGIVYESTTTTADVLVDNYWDWFFLAYESKEDFVFFDLPTYPEAVITVEISGVTTECGRLVAGTSRLIGDSLYGSTTGSQSYTLRERDGFGNLSIVPRRTINVTEYKVAIETSSIATVKRHLSNSASEPALFFAAPNVEGLINFGLAEDFRVPYELPTVSKCTIEVKSI